MKNIKVIFTWCLIAAIAGANVYLVRDTLKSDVSLKQIVKMAYASGEDDDDGDGVANRDEIGGSNNNSGGNDSTCSQCGSSFDSCTCANDVKTTGRPDEQGCMVTSYNVGNTTTITVGTELSSSTSFTISSTTSPGVFTYCDGSNSDVCDSVSCH